MTRLRKIVGLTLAVALAVAFVAYVFRPSAAPTTSSTSQPPPDQTCPPQGRGHSDATCGPGTGTTGGGPNDDHDTKDRHDRGHHYGHSNGNHGSNGHHGDKAHHGRALGHEKQGR